jgi:hypothetical protein
MPEITRRTIVGAADRDRVAVVSFVVPAGAEIDIKPWWSFQGWSAALANPVAPLDGGLRALIAAVEKACPVCGGDGWTTEADPSDQTGMTPMQVPCWDAEHSVILNGLPGIAANPVAPLDVERLGYRELLDVATAILTKYPPDTIVCSHNPEADIGARAVAAIADLVQSAHPDAPYDKGNDDQRRKMQDGPGGLSTASRQRISQRSRSRLPLSTLPRTPQTARSGEQHTTEGSGLCDAPMSDGWTCTRLPGHEGVHQ